MQNVKEDIVKLANEARTRIKEITPDEAKRRIASGATLIDVREEKACQAGHIAGAIQVSRNTLEARISELVPDKSGAIVCYCALGHNSAIAADHLQRLGYVNVISIEGGLKAFQASAKEPKAQGLGNEANSPQTRRLTKAVARVG